MHICEPEIYLSTDSISIWSVHEYMYMYTVSTDGYICKDKSIFFKAKPL